MEKIKEFKKAKGIVFNIVRHKNFGFIRQEDGTSIFFHEEGVTGEGYKKLREGETVEYLIAETPRGPKAIGVQVLFTL